MSGAVTQLVAQGMQDVYLTGEPQTSHFVQKHKRHTQFAMETVRQIFKGEPTAGGMSSVTLKRTGDLIGDMYLLNETHASISRLNGLVERFELYIGGQKIDDYASSSAVTIGHSGGMGKGGSNSLVAYASADFLPLQFFNALDSSACIPIVALSHHDVEVRIYWAAAAPAGDLAKISFYADYMYLDTAERNVYASKPVQLLITQHQDVIVAEDSKAIDLPFSHPVRAIYIADEGDARDAPVNGAGLKLTLDLNGTERFEPQSIHYFQTAQKILYSEHGGLNGDGPLVYSFALDYGDCCPSGTCNFSRIDNARLRVTAGSLLDGSVPARITAVNYNILKCENGLGGLMFAN